jgi:uncharacterized phage-associated protein
MSGVLEVASYLIRLGREHTIDGEYDLTPVKLQRLVYYCQGVHLALYDKPLFPEPIEAWTHGPVCPALYGTLKQAGAHPVGELDAKDDLTGTEKRLIAGAYQQYGQFAAWKLRNMTRKETPWAAAQISGIISPESITHFFNDLKKAR